MNLRREGLDLGCSWQSQDHCLFQRSSHAADSIINIDPEYQQLAIYGLCRIIITVLGRAIFNSSILNVLSLGLLSLGWIMWAAQPPGDSFDADPVVRSSGRRRRALFYPTYSTMKRIYVRYEPRYRISTQVKV